MAVPTDPLVLGVQLDTQFRHGPACGPRTRDVACRTMQPIGKDRHVGYLWSPNGGFMPCTCGIDALVRGP